MNIKKVVVFGLMAVAMAATSVAAPSISDVVAKQRYPWNGLVDIDFTLHGEEASSFSVTIMALDCIGGTNLTVSSLISNGCPIAENPISLKPGKHRISWNSSLDLSNGYRSDNVVITVSATHTSGKFMIVDLTNGAISYQNNEPVGGWNTEEYRTTKMAFLRVEAGTYKQCYSGTEYGRLVSITKPFYISIFPLTCKNLRMLGYDDLVVHEDDDFHEFPCYQSTWSLQKYLRGSSYRWPNNGRKVDTKSTIGKLRSITGNENFDLPTSGVLGLALKSTKLSQISKYGFLCIDFQPLDIGECHVIDPMGPLNNDMMIGQSGFNDNPYNVQLDEFGNVKIPSSCDDDGVRICLYDVQ